MASYVQGVCRAHGSCPTGGSGLKKDDLTLAHVHWYQFVPAPSDQTNEDPVLGCPFLGKRLTNNNPEGNICLVEQLLPCKLAALPYKHDGHNQLVIVSRFAGFMEPLRMQ